MKQTRSMPSIERLRELLAYDPLTGVLTWRVSRVGRVRAGDAVQCKRPDGYIKVCVDQVQMRAHRAAWAIHHGEWPAGEIDHINGDRADNRIANLRDLPRGLNQQNVRAAQTNNRSGYLGVCLVHGKWRAGVSHGGRFIQVGKYDSPEEAHEAYVQKKRELHAASTL